MNGWKRELLIFVNEFKICFVYQKALCLCVCQNPRYFVDCSCFRAFSMWSGHTFHPLSCRRCRRSGIDFQLLLPFINSLVILTRVSDIWFGSFFVCARGKTFIFIILWFNVMHFGWAAEEGRSFKFSCFVIALNVTTIHQSIKMSVKRKQQSTNNQMICCSMLNCKRVFLGSQNHSCAQ